METNGAVFVDLGKGVEKSADMAALLQVVEALLGQDCLRLELSYGDELVLHLGEPRPYSNKKLAQENKGSWILSARGSRWRLLLLDPPSFMLSPGWPKIEIGKPISPADIERKAERLIGAKVVSVTLRPYPLQKDPHLGCGLTLGFRNGAVLAIVPSDEEDDDNSDVTISDWELLTPYSMHLKCGPGLNWSYKSSSLPAVETVCPEK